jgi:hypothetical protein
MLKRIDDVPALPIRTGFVRGFPLPISLSLCPYEMPVTAVGGRQRLHFHVSKYPSPLGLYLCPTLVLSRAYLPYFWSVALRESETMNRMHAL